MFNRYLQIFSIGGFAIAHNGVTNALKLRNELVQVEQFSVHIDTEVLLQLIARSKSNGVINRFVDALKQIDGAYALVALTADKLIGARDPLGIRPLILGKLENRFILSSETCALDIIGAKFVREIENGEVVVISGENIESIRPFPEIKKRPCIFEYIYFATR